MGVTKAVVLGLAAIAACCLSPISAGTLKAAAAESINVAEARGILNSPLHANEAWHGPPVIAFALPIALLMIIFLWISAYNNIRSPPPKIGYNAGLVESAGWGGAQASTYVSGGWGYDAAASEQQASVASNIAAQTVAQTAGVVSPVGVAATARAFDDLTHRVVRSIERHEEQQQ